MYKTSHAFSVLTSRAMDLLGYSYYMVQERKKIPKAVEKGFRKDGKVAFRSICVGSKGEGLTFLLESDFDVMAEFRDVVCTNDVSSYRNEPKMTVYAVERENASPGYTYLRLLQSGVTDNEFLELDNNTYLRSTITNSALASSIANVSHVAGPAFNIDLMQLSSIDCVAAIRCECPEIKQAFVSRQRKHDQPSQEVLDEVAKLNTHVVPVGNSSFSDHSDIEWRICDTEAELYLMGKLNETQLQLYVLLKLLAKSILKEVDGISSYILKTVVLWMVELNHRDKFQKETLVQRLLQALEILRQCVKRRYLPNYMLPQRNMFSGKLLRQDKVLELLTHMIDEGETVVLLCPRLREAILDMYVSPERAQHLGGVRDKVEVLCIRLSCGDINLFHMCPLVAVFVWFMTYCLQDWEAYMMKIIDFDTFTRRAFLKLGNLDINVAVL